MGTTGDKEADYLSSLQLEALALQDSVGRGLAEAINKSKGKDFS